MYKAVDVYLEKTSARRYVGRLKKVGGKFSFEYSDAYQYSESAIPFGPDLPINKKTHFSLKLFPSFVDRIPSRENPAYEEYCRSAGISPSEKNPFALLAKLGRKGPSSFILAPVFEEAAFSREDLKQFRKDLNLSIREFAELFDVSSATVYRIENNKSSGKNVLKRIEIYFNSPKKALAKIEHTGHKINDEKRNFAQTFLKSKIQKKIIGHNPFFTVTAKDIQKCSPQQAVELLRRLMLSESYHYGIPGSGVHISSNVSAKDGGQDGLAKWTQGPIKTNYFPCRHNCFQVKASSLSPSKIIKEISDNQNPGKLNKAVQYVVKKKGAYILCSTHGAAGVKVQDIESKIKREIQVKTDSLDNIQVKFYDGNRLADWVNCYASVAVWFLQEILGKSVRPWKSWLEWSREGLDYRSEFMSHSELDKKRQGIRAILSRPGGAIHLTGAGGLGKTRLVLEAFRPPTSQKFNDSNKSQEDLSYLVLYSSAEELKGFPFKELSARAIVIIDDCSIEQAEYFHKALSAQKISGVSLLTIGNEGNEESICGALRHIWREKKEMEKQIITLEPDEDIVKKMLLKSQNITNQYPEHKFRELTSGFPLMATLLKGAGPVDLLKEDIPTIRNKMLWGRQAPDKEGSKVISACSLFDTICFSGEGLEIKSGSSVKRGKEEARYIAETICDLDYKTFYEKIQFFKKRKIIQQHGRFIQVRPKPLAVWLANDLIEKTPPESITKWFVDMGACQELYKLDAMEEKLYSKTEQKDFIGRGAGNSALNGLRESFCKGLSYSGSFSGAQNSAKLLCEEGGFFGSEEALNTEWGLRCFKYLAELNPTEALKTLQRIFKNKSPAELQNIFTRKTYRTAGKAHFPRELIWTLPATAGSAELAALAGKAAFPSELIGTLQKLAVTKELYPQSAELLLKFAEAEESGHWGRAANVFIKHFQLYLSGTEAPPNLKFQIIDEITKSKSIKQKEIALQALNRALEINGFSRSSDIVQTNSGQSFEDWRPKTYSEQWDYMRMALKHLAQFATKDKNREIKKKACDFIASNLHGLFKQGLYDEAEDAIKEIVSVQGTHQPLATNEILFFLKYNSKKITEKNKKQIDGILNLLQPKEALSERIRSYITECRWVDPYDQGQKHENKKYREQFDQLIKDFVKFIDNQKQRSSGLKSLNAAALKQKKTAPEQLRNAYGIDKKISPYLKILFHGEQINTFFFAKRTAELLKDPLKFALKFLDFIQKHKEDKDFNPAFLSGFTAGLNKADKEKFLDKIAEDSGLADFLIPACRSMDLQDRDITRFINVIDKINLKSTGLKDLRDLAIGQKCKSVNSEIMGKLIQALSQKGIRFSWDALQIYNYYEGGDKSEKKNKLLPVLYDLLTQDKLLSDKDKYDIMDDDYYEKAANDLLDSDYAASFSNKFISQILALKTSVFDWPVSSETIRKCLSKIIEKYPDMILLTIINNIDNVNMDFLFKTASVDQHQTDSLAGLNTEQINRHQTDPLERLSIKRIKRWCETNPDKIPAFLVKNMSLSKGQSWSPVARFLLDEYGDRANVIDALSIGLGRFSWRPGGLLDYFEKTKKLARKLTGHKHKSVRDFAEKEISHLDKMIRSQKEREKELEEFGI